MTLLAVLSGLSTKILKGLNATLTIQPPQLLVVDQHAFAADHEKQTAIAKAPAYRRQIAQADANGRIVRSKTEIANRGPISPNHFTRPPLTDLKT